MKKFSALLLALLLSVSVLVAPVQAQCCEVNTPGTEDVSPESGDTDTTNYDDLIMTLEDWPDTKTESH